MSICSLSLRTLPATLLFVFLSIGSLSAQEFSQRSTEQELREGFKLQIYLYAVDYWTPKLQEYKRYIDSTLSADDLNTLTTLRVRWALFSEAERMGKRRESGASKGVDGMESVGLEDDEEILATLKPKETHFYELPLIKEVFSISDRYRPMYNVVGKRIFSDMLLFTEGLAPIRDKYVAAHLSEIYSLGADSTVDWFYLAGYNDPKRRVEDVGLIMAYAGEEIFALVALYNGGTLAALLGYEALTFETGDGASGKLTRLLQNNPNPASTNIVVSFCLVEPSNSTKLRVYDSTGSIIADVNLGAVSSGDHEVSLNVTSFPAGNYVYHLTVQSSMGEEVYSKVMYVVR